MPQVNGVDLSRKRDLNEALELLHFAYRKVTERPDRILASQGLSRMHHRILHAVARSRAISIRDLLQLMGISKQALNRPLRQLLAGGWVEAEPDASNKRLKIVRLTPRGRTLEERLSQNQRQRFAAAFDAVGRDAEHSWRKVMTLLAEREPIQEER